MTTLLALARPTLPSENWSSKLMPCQSGATPRSLRTSLPGTGQSTVADQRFASFSSDTWIMLVDLGESFFDGPLWKLLWVHHTAAMGFVLQKLQARSNQETDDGKRCSAWKYYQKGRGGWGGAKLMTENDEYRFELLPGRFCWGGVGGGWKFEILICRLLGCLEAGSKVQKTL